MSKEYQLKTQKPTTAMDVVSAVYDALGIKGSISTMPAFVDNATAIIVFEQLPLPQGNPPLEESLGLGKSYFTITLPKGVKIDGKRKTFTIEGQGITPELIENVRLELSGSLAQ